MGDTRGAGGGTRRCWPRGQSTSYHGEVQEPRAVSWLEVTILNCTLESHLESGSELLSPLQPKGHDEKWRVCQPTSQQWLFCNIAHHVITSSRRTPETGTTLCVRYSSADLDLRHSTWRCRGFVPDPSTWTRVSLPGHNLHLGPNNSMLSGLSRLCQLGGSISGLYPSGANHTPSSFDNEKKTPHIVKHLPRDKVVLKGGLEAHESFVLVSTFVNKRLRLEIRFLPSCHPGRHLSVCPLFRKPVLCICPEWSLLIWFSA